MRRVLKYQWKSSEPGFADIPEVPVFMEFNMPVGAEIVAFQLQREIPCIWAMGDTDQVLETRSFHLVGTGHEAPDGKYVGTVQMEGGSLVLHAIEKGR